MTSYTSPATWSAATLTAAQLNEQLRDNLKNVDERLVLHNILSSTRLNQVESALCGVRLTGSATQTIPDDADTTVTWDTETYDSDGFHSTSSNTDRITIPTGLGGYYKVTFVAQWAATPTASEIWVEDDGGNVIGHQRLRGTGGDGSGQTHELSFYAALAAGDWIRARVRIAAGPDQDLDKHVSPCSFTAWRIFAS